MPAVEDWTSIPDPLNTGCSIALYTLRNDGLKKVLDGKTTIEEVLRVTQK